jgi:RimJ/RimL family protein N-acetyltransferase
MFQPEYPIRTARLLLRPYTLDDVDALYEYQRLPEVARYLEGEARSRAEVEAIVTTRAGVGPPALTAEGDLLPMVAELADSGVVVGDCVLFWRSVEHRGGEIGYVFSPAYHGRGLATETARALLRLGFEGLGLHRIVARCDARNVPSWRVMERIGMRREAHLVRNEFLKGEWSDELIYAILRSEWEAQQAAG